MRDPRGGHTSGDVPLDHLPQVSDRAAAGAFRHGVPTVVTTIPCEPHMHVKFGTNRSIPLLAYAVWSDGRCTPIFPWPAHGQIRACGVDERGWALVVVPPTSGLLESVQVVDSDGRG